MRLPREDQRGIAALALQLAREQRHEGGGEGAFREQAAEQVGQLERHDERVGDRPRAQHRRQDDVAHEADDAAQQREAADGGDGAAEAHGRSITAIILSSLPAILSTGGGRRCDGRYKPLPRPVP